MEATVLSKEPLAKVCLLRPSIAYFILKAPDPLASTDALPDFRETTHIFLPVNDNPNVDQPGGGTHWSLLLLSIIDRRAFHYDSLNRHNEGAAYELTNRFTAVLNMQSSPLEFVNIDSPQQNNGKDCGVFVCFLIQTLLRNNLLVANTEAKVNMSMAGKGIDAASGRKEILRTIEKFRDANNN